jgi:molybdopterin-guanine dinucleotide biosynthesis protein A
MTGIAGLVLAGGGASRLGGGDKPLLALGGRSMLSRILETMAADLSAIAISANGNPGRFAAFGLPVLGDGAFDGRGPLAGLLAGLDWAAALGCSALLTVPGDTPFIPRGLPKVLAPAPACVVQAGRRHHLVALWPPMAGASLRSWLNSGGARDVATFAATIGMRGISVDRRPDQQVHDRFAAVRFTNVNTRDDLAVARRLAEEMDDPDGGDRWPGGDRPASGPRA